MYKQIDVVIVTYNRLEKLKRTINAFDSQTTLPKRIIIVNNNSNDGTMEFLEEWRNKKYEYDKVVLNLPENIGGSGGFFHGIQFALNNKADWIWVSDDDAYPEESAIEYALNYINNHDMNNVSAICGQVIEKNAISYAHRRNIQQGIIRIKETNSKKSDYIKEEFDIDLFTYVGTVMNAKKVKEVGNVNKDFFIHYDDTEHSERLRKVGRIICIPKIKVIHDIQNRTINEKVSWKNYYSYRNKLYFFKNNFGKRYSNFEKLLIYLRIIKKHNYACTKLILTAIKDFNNNKLGMHDVYKPGWTFKKK